MKPEELEAIMENSQRFMDQVEALVDQVGMNDMVDFLTAIAYAKAEHLRTNWQDEKSAKIWEHDAKILARTYPKLWT